VKPDKIYKVKISVTGLTRAQAEEGLPYLIDEYHQRPWLFETEAYWDETTNKLITIVGYDLEIRLEEGALGEVRDCVIATMQFDREIKFCVEKT